jgi:ketosteroid isomerase-like protein
MHRAGKAAAPTKGGGPLVARLVAATFVAGSVACAQAPVPEAGDRATPATQDTGAISDQMDAAYARFSEGYRTADAAMVADLYTDDAFYLQPGSDIMRGRPAVLDFFDSFLGPFRERGEPGPDLSFEILERRIAGPIGYDIGYFLFASVRAGKFTVIWRLDADGVWRIHSDGYSGLQ